MSSINSSPRFVALDRELHAGLRLSSPTDLSFAADYSVVPLVVTEFTAAAREYAIVFIRDANQEWMPVVLTGAPHQDATHGNNVYVDQGHWRAQYVPAYVRRHPFALAQTADDQLTVCIDESCAWFATDEGTPLFDSGEPSSLLQQVMARMTDYQHHVALTQAFTQRLVAAELLTLIDARIDLNGEHLDVNGVAMVSEAKLRALPAETLQQWVANGDLGLIYAHLISFSNSLELLRRQPRVSAAADSSSMTLSTAASENFQ